MDQGIIIDLVRQGLYTVIIVVAPVLGAGLATGLLVAILQATTQIQEQTLAFVPKIFVVLIAIGVFGPWMLNTFVDFVTELFSNIPQYIG